MGRGVGDPRDPVDSPDGAMKAYASRTGTRRNLAALRRAGWGLLLSRTGVWRTEGFSDYVLDNGAWTDFQRGQEFDAVSFSRLLSEFGDGAQWVVAPDIVAGGLRSLDLSVKWLPTCSSACRRVLIAVQDGMTPDDLSSLVSETVGVFVGGTTDWKLRPTRLLPSTSSRLRATI
jgi:hypothetical protein